MARLACAALTNARKIARDDVALPGRILEPDQVGHAARQRNEVDLAVVIHIARHHLIAASEVGGDGMGPEFRRARTEVHGDRSGEHLR